MAGQLVSDQDAPSEAFTGRASLLYLFDSGIAPYVSYSEAFEPQFSGQIFTGDPSFGRLPDPITSRQFEAGVKYQPPGTDILLTAAAFDIKRQNSLSPDIANGPRFSIQNGEVSVQGVEFEARANVTENLTVVGGFSLIDAINSAGTGTTLKRDDPPDRGPRRPAPDPGAGHHDLALRQLSGPHGHVRRPRLRRRVPLSRRLAGRRRQQLQGAGEPRRGMAVASYDFSYLSPSLKGMQLQVNAQNLLDETYVQSCAFQAWCWYGAPRTVLATLRYRW